MREGKKYLTSVLAASKADGTQLEKVVYLLWVLSILNSCMVLMGGRHDGSTALSKPCTLSQCQQYRRGLFHCHILRLGLYSERMRNSQRSTGLR